MTTTQLDYSVGIGKETTYGVAATPTRFLESDAAMKADVQKEQSAKFRPGKRVQRLNRSVLKQIEVSGDQSLEATTKGLGFLLEAALGTVTNTLIPDTSPAVYQQVHTIRKADPIPSYTIQEVLPTIGGGAGHPHTFTGCVVDSLELSAKTGGIVEVKLSWLGRDMSTDIAAAAASYPVGDELFAFVHGSIGHTGTLTAPTATDLAELSGAASDSISDFSVSITNNLDTGGYNFGGHGRRSRPNVLGKAEISGKLTAEYTSNELRDAYLNQTPLPLVLTFATDTVLSETPSDTVAVLQIVIPAVLLKGEVPTASGEPITQSIDWEAYDNGSAAEPIWIVYRTLDTTP